MQAAAPVTPWSCWPGLHSGGAGTDGVQFDGDPKTFTTIVALTDQSDPAFPIVTA
jgi:hypothetical protein